MDFGTLHRLMLDFDAWGKVGKEIGLVMSLMTACSAAAALSWLP